MRDPINWSIPIGRFFGIAVKVHLLFPLVALGLILRIATQKDMEPGLWVEMAAILAWLFVAVFLHELGHCFAARYVDGEAHDILIWPLGGLAYVEVPHTWKANFIVAAAGPAANLVLCFVTGLMLLALSLWPPLSPLWNPLRPTLSNWAEGAEMGSKYRPGEPLFIGFRNNGKWVSAEAAKAGEGLEMVRVPVDDVKSLGDGSFGLREAPAIRLDMQPLELNVAQIGLARFFWVNWTLFLLNIILVGFPLDAGRMFQCLLWPRVGYRQATLYAVMAGFFVSCVVALVAFGINEVLTLFLALFIYASCKQQWFILETGGEESAFGYDFSQGYTSLERDQPAVVPKRQPNFFRRWLEKRAARKLQREQEQREAEEQRMDELLEKIQRSGKTSLTDEERRFLERVSHRYKNR
jgi:Zn-dependent protease